jgi:Skp family chaperone for outer membrane proteins
MVCNKGLPSHFNTQSPTWADILQVVLYALGISHPQKEFFSLGKEIYDYIDVHWDKLSAKPRSSTWKQTAKMTLAHSRYANLFENGYDIFMKTGFWRLKKQTNPYEMSGMNGASRPSHDTSDRAEELPSEESDHELRADRSWESNGGKLNSPPAYKINYLLAENNGPQQSIPNLSAYNPAAVQMPPPPMAPQFYNAYNSFQKPQMNSPPSQFNSIKPNDFISQAPNPNFYPSIVNNAAPGQSIPPLPHHAFFSRRFSVDEGAKTLEDLRNAANFGVAEPESGFYPQQHRLPDVNNNPVNLIENAPIHASSEMVLNTPQIKEEQIEAIVQKQQNSSAAASPTQIPAAPQRRRSVQYDSTNNFAVPESRSTMRSSNPLQMDGYVNTSGLISEQYQRSISLEDELKSKNQLISKLYEELDSYKKHAENLRQALEDRDRSNKEMSGVIASLQSQLQKEQESSQMFQQLAKYNEDQRIRLESVYKQMGDLMGGRQNNRSPDQMRPYPFSTGIMNVAATPSGDARSGGFQSLNTSGGKMSPDVDNLRYS